MSGLLARLGLEVERGNCSLSREKHNLNTAARDCTSAFLIGMTDTRQDLGGSCPSALLVTGYGSTGSSRKKQSARRNQHPRRSGVVPNPWRRPD